MSEKESEFLKNLKRILTISIGSGLVLLVGVLVTFYFTTNFKIGEHDKRIDSMEAEKVSIIEYNGHVRLEEQRSDNIIRRLDEIQQDIRDLH